jgi:adenine specific DNA methylase Mod
MDTNVLYYGDNLEILRKYIPDNSIDLVYLDPPFNSKATYNVLYKEKTGEPSQAQITAFEDTWHWGLESEKALQEIFESPIAPSAVKDFMSVMPKFLGKKTDMAAYLTMMCVRLLELRRVLKDTGSIYLHCDPTASHYLKIVMDAIFGVVNFRNEIVWKRADTVKGNIGQGSRFFDRNTDSLLFYAKADSNIFNPIFKGYSQEYIETSYRHVEPQTGRRYQLISMTAPGGSAKGNPQYEVMGVTRFWRYSKGKMQSLIDAGLVFQSRPGVVPRRKLYLDEGRGVSVQSLWDDVSALHSQAAERLGYPTQKPEVLLERIIQASSNEGDIVLDPFCGCGTALVVAQKLNRKWIGIDITHLAISTMKWRLEKMFPNIQYKVIGEPKDLASAKELANQNKYQFQWWVISLVGGQPYGDKKKGADTGIDGYLYFMDEKNKIKKAIIQVKAGTVSVSQIRDLIGVIQREKAEMGVFLCLESATKQMQMEADSQGFYHSPLGKDYPKIQIFTIEQLLEGKKPDIPPWIAPVDTPPTAKKSEGKIIKML